MNYQLSRAEIDQFHFQGFLGPYTAMTPEELSLLTSLFTRKSLQRPALI